jgi:hypothetical protein
MALTRKFKEIEDADSIIALLLEKNEKMEKGKLTYAWKRFVEKNYRSLATELGDKLQDNRVEHAMTDPKTKELLYTNDKNTSYKYTKEGMKALLEAQRKLKKEYEEMDIEIVPFFVKKEDLPELNEEEREILTGLIIEDNGK